MFLGHSHITCIHFVGEAQGAQRFARVFHRGAHVYEHEGFGVPLQAVLQQVGQRGVAKGHVLLLLRERHDDVAERAQTLVDRVCLLELLTFCPRLPNLLTPRQVHEHQVPAPRRPRLRVDCAHFQQEHDVAAARRAVHFRGGHAAVGLRAREQGEHVFHAFNGVHAQTVHRRVSVCAVLHGGHAAAQHAAATAAACSASGRCGLCPNLPTATRPRKVVWHTRVTPGCVALSHKQALFAAAPLGPWLRLRHFAR
mmetsp:Transcript_5954/g.11162  ORF Transcript_5954/g.11162 Transcript_5954/m.11162 type:complete len:253 (+) Transcript_5954:353-1111(+)